MILPIIAKLPATHNYNYNNYNYNYAISSYAVNDIDIEGGRWIYKNLWLHFLSQTI